MESRVKSEKKITHSAGIRLLKDLAGAVLAGLLAVLFINRGVLLHHADVSDAEASAILMEKEAAENNGRERWMLRIRYFPKACGKRLTQTPPLSFVLTGR